MKHTHWNAIEMQHSAFLTVYISSLPPLAATLAKAHTPSDRRHKTHTLIPHTHTAALQFSIICPSAKIKCTTKEDLETGLIAFCWRTISCVSPQLFCWCQTHQLLRTSAAEIFNPSLARQHDRGRLSLPTDAAEQDVLTMKTSSF